MTAITVLLSPQKQAVSATGGTLDVLVRVQAPDLPEGQPLQQSPKRLALVVDRSGSMDGQPLEEALRCVEHIATHLGPKDQVSIVVYDSRVDVLRPLGPVGSAQEIHQLLQGISSGGNTALFDGWHEGAGQLGQGGSYTISRVLLLSDGQANEGLTDVLAIEEHCRRWLERGVSTTTVGLGRHFNEDLMIAMARAGGGQQYYGQTAEDLHDSFAEELALLQSMYARQVDVKLIPAPGAIIETLGAVRQNTDGSYRLSDLAWGAETWVALRLHLSPGTVGQPRDLLAVSVNAIDLQGAPLSATAPMLQLPTVERAAFDALPAEELTERRVQEVEFAAQSLRLRELARRHDQAGVRSLMTALDARFGGNAWLKEKLSTLRDLAARDLRMMEKEVSFSHMRYNTRLSAKDEVAFCHDETNLFEMPAFLRKKASEGRGRKPT